MPKIFESIIAKKLGLLCRNVIVDEQHGFVTGRSTTSNLALYSAFITAEIEDGHQVDAVYTDFSKAFDTVDHSVLLNKLNMLGIGGRFLRWLACFLSDRTQFVDFNGSLSRPISVTSGVPQGSHIGPLLFLLFINDITDIFKHSKFLLYADDLKIYRRIDGFADALLLQDDLRRLESWCDVNRLRLNVGKCHVVHFHHKTCPCLYDYRLGAEWLLPVNTIRDLGVIFSYDLTFREHIDATVSVAYKSLGFILRWGRCFKADTLRLLYCAFVRSRLEYCSIVWSPYHGYQRVMMERVQHKFLRYVSYRMGTPMEFACHDYTPIMMRTNILSLEHRRIIAGLMFVYNVFCNGIRSTALLESLDINCPQRSLRGHLLMRTHVHGTLYGFNSVINRICTHINRLPIHIDPFCMSPAAFRSAVAREIVGW